MRGHDSIPFRFFVHLRTLNLSSIRVANAMTGAAFYSAVEAVPFIITGPVGNPVGEPVGGSTEIANN